MSQFQPTSSKAFHPHSLSVSFFLTLTFPSHLTRLSLYSLLPQRVTLFFVSVLIFFGLANSTNLCFSLPIWRHPHTYIHRYTHRLSDDEAKSSKNSRNFRSKRIICSRWGPRDDWQDLHFPGFNRAIWFPASYLWPVWPEWANFENSWQIHF